MSHAFFKPPEKGLAGSNKKMENLNLISSKKITNSIFSDYFVLHSNKMGFTTLADIFKYDVTTLMNHHLFNYKWFGELTDFLDERNAVKLLIDC